MPEIPHAQTGLGRETTELAAQLREVSLGADPTVYVWALCAELGWALVHASGGQTTMEELLIAFQRLTTEAIRREQYGSIQ